MANKVAWMKIEGWEFQKILNEIAEGTKTGAHTLEKKKPMPEFLKGQNHGNSITHRD